MSGLFQDDKDNNDFIQLLSQEEEDEMNREKTPETLPILPLRNTVLFPGVVIPITVGRDKSIKLIKDAHKGDKIIGVVSQKDALVEDPNFSDLNTVGTVAQILKMLRMPDGNTTVIIQGKKRFVLGECQAVEPYIRASVSAIDEKKTKPDEELKALISSIKELSPCVQSLKCAARLLHLKRGCSFLSSQWTWPLNAWRKKCTRTMM